MKTQILTNSSRSANFVKPAMGVVFVISGFVLAIVFYLLNKNFSWQLDIQTLPNIMPVLIALIAFFAIGYSVVCVLTSQLFNNILHKNKDFSYLEY